MKIKNQLSIFNVITRLLLLLLLGLLLPMVVEHVVYKHINTTLLEKKRKFIEHLNNTEINEFLDKSQADDTYASFSVLHDEFILLSKLGDRKMPSQSVFINEPRIIEKQRDEYRILQYTFNYENKSYQLEIGNSISEISDLTFMIRVFILVVLLIVVLVTFLIDSLFIDFLLRPFYKIIDTKIRRVNEPDSFNFTPIPSHSTDFRELDEVLNQMMERIEGHFKLEKQFIANVSHELLTPISILKSRFENLIQDSTLGEVVVDKIVASLKTLDLLSKIIGNLLLISRIENNQYAKSEAVDLQVLLKDIEQDFEDRCIQKEIDFTLNIRHNFVFHANATLLHILFFNLISNAIKYNIPNGAIVIEDDLSESEYAITISDTGSGMDAQKLGQIFKRFERLNFDQEGLGLGLSIVDSILKFHNLKIAVTSEVGRGSVFRVVFDLRF